MFDAFLAYLHYVGVMGLLAALWVQYVFIHTAADRNSARQLVNAGLGFWAAFLVVLLSGLMRLMYFGKGFAFYAENPLFHVKMTLVMGAALLAVYPSIEFRRMRQQIRDGNESGFAVGRARRLVRVIRLEILVVLLIPLTAVLMGRGFGY